MTPPNPLHGEKPFGRMGRPAERSTRFQFYCRDRSLDSEGDSSVAEGSCPATFGTGLGLVHVRGLEGRALSTGGSRTENSYSPANSPERRQAAHGATATFTTETSDGDTIETGGVARPCGNDEDLDSALSLSRLSTRINGVRTTPCIDKNDRSECFSFARGERRDNDPLCSLLQSPSPLVAALEGCIGEAGEFPVTPDSASDSPPTSTDGFEGLRFVKPRMCSSNPFSSSTEDSALTPEFDIDKFLARAQSVVDGNGDAPLSLHSEVFVGSYFREDKTSDLAVEPKITGQQQTNEKNLIRLHQDISVLEDMVEQTDRRLKGLGEIALKTEFSVFPLSVEHSVERTPQKDAEDFESVTRRVAKFSQADSSEADSYPATSLPTDKFSQTDFLPYPSRKLESRQEVGEEVAGGRQDKRDIGGDSTKTRMTLANLKSPRNSKRDRDSYPRAAWAFKGVESERLRLPGPDTRKGPGIFRVFPYTVPDGLREVPHCSDTAPRLPAYSTRPFGCEERSRASPHACAECWSETSSAASGLPPDGHWQAHETPLGDADGIRDLDRDNPSRHCSSEKAWVQPRGERAAHEACHPLKCPFYADPSAPQNTGEPLAAFRHSPVGVSRPWQRPGWGLRFEQDPRYDGRARCRRCVPRISGTAFLGQEPANHTSSARSNAESVAGLRVSTCSPWTSACGDSTSERKRCVQQSEDSPTVNSHRESTQAAGQANPRTPPHCGQREKHDVSSQVSPSSREVMAAGAPSCSRDDPLVKLRESACSPIPSVPPVLVDQKREPLNRPSTLCRSPAEKDSLLQHTADSAFGPSCSFQQSKNPRRSARDLRTVLNGTVLNDAATGTSPVSRGPMATGASPRPTEPTEHDRHGTFSVAGSATVPPAQRITPQDAFASSHVVDVPLDVQQILSRASAMERERIPSSAHRGNGGNTPAAGSRMETSATDGVQRPLEAHSALTPTTREVLEAAATCHQSGEMGHALTRKSFTRGESPVWPRTGNGGISRVPGNSPPDATFSLPEPHVSACR
ncbi:conserved hypothetical protein [Neospora caninum Liverpool]|uniref:Uncharacterized protein n=1 Tax=Neospora caninum (strain Liverpool) TaxID=572307 RepID=F0VDY0_NEOCL|nr:conserved hypothetical protein [Neospora caninum Liverpool]CBZ51923.1 conserved hypothetical protein [Neospora caninum Liverpool]|eukprot:XP_003881956.1 conserved hypothetical protein [Neospora caninum Liverpool]